MKVNFKKPKYILPLFLLPFIFLFYYLFGRPKEGAEIAKTKVVQKQEGLQTTMPGVDTAIANKSVKDKFKTYQKYFRHARDSSAIRDVRGQEDLNSPYGYSSAYTNKDLVKMRHARKMDSLNQSLAEGQAKLKEALTSFHQATNRNQTYQNPLDKSNLNSNKKILQALNKMNQPTQIGTGQGETYQNKDLKAFKERMLFMDSLRKATMAQGKAVSKGFKAGYNPYKKFDPSKDTSFNPLPISTSKTPTSVIFNTISNIHDDPNAITAMIDQNIKVRLGSRVRIRLLKDIYVGEYKIEKGTYLYGMVTGFQTQRVNISITQIQYHNKSLPVSIDVFDNDGYLGLYVPGSNFREFSKEIGTQATRGMSQIITPDESDIKMNLLSQVFNTTTTAMASLIRKDKAFLKYNYIVYLKEDKTGQK